MAWIESHQTLRGHPKTKKLSRLIGCSIAETVGYLHFFWWWALDYAETGNVSTYDIEDIEDAIDWQKEPGMFYQSLVSVGFVEEDGEIHDWFDYAGKLIERRERNAERMREARAKHKNKSATHVQRTSSARVKLPDQPNQTKPEEASVFAKFADTWYSRTTRSGSGGSGFGLDHEKLMAVYDEWMPLLGIDRLVEGISIAAVNKGAAATPAYLNGIYRRMHKENGKSPPSEKVELPPLEEVESWNY